MQGAQKSQKGGGGATAATYDAPHSRALLFALSAMSSAPSGGGATAAAAARKSANSAADIGVSMSVKASKSVTASYVESTADAGGADPHHGASAQCARGE